MNTTISDNFNLYLYCSLHIAPVNVILISIYSYTEYSEIIFNLIFLLFADISHLSQGRLTYQPSTRY